MKLGTVLVLLASTTLSGCLDENVADKREREQTSILTAAASTQVGMPAIFRFTEKRNMKMLYELRDDPKLVTVTYIVDMKGQLHKICDSLGYGFPYATQYTNPQRDLFYSGSSGNHFLMPQPEPNGLFMPSSADGTWVMCLNPENKEVQPIYVEPRVIISPFALK